MKLRGTLRRIAGLAVGWMLALAGPSAADVEGLRAATVKISVEHSLGREIGSGIILCHRGGRLDVLTAKHVVTGVGLVDDFGKPLGKRFSEVRKIEVAFYRQARSPVVVATTAVRTDEFKDLAILTVWGVEGRLSTAEVGSSTGLGASQEVQSVGHRAGLSDGEWFWTDGKVQQSGGFIHHSSRITGGFSGGPLFDRAGRVVGINIQTVGDVARAMRIEEAALTVRPWLDPGCLGQEVVKPPPPPPAGRWKDPVLGADFVYVEPGSFWMGSPASEAGRQDDERRHRVTLTRGFWMATTEVTRGQFEEFVKETSYETEAEKEGYSWAWDGTTWEKKAGVTWRDSGGRDHPVVHVSWNDAKALCEWLGRRTGQQIRLPTEAEWEYAARAATQTATYAGDLILKSDCDAPELEGIAWYCGNSGNTSHEVGGKRANDWELYDMLGNVWEWTEDAADWDAVKKEVVTETYGGYVADPLSKRGSYRVLRGGGWFNNARYCRSADRDSHVPGDRGANVGFRLVRTLP